MQKPTRSELYASRQLAVQKLKLDRDQLQEIGRYCQKNNYVFIFCLYLTYLFLLRQKQRYFVRFCCFFRSAKKTATIFVRDPELEYTLVGVYLNNGILEFAAKRDSLASNLFTAVAHS